MPDRTQWTVAAAGTELVIARHGESYDNVDGRLAGPACRGLTARGRAAARALGARLAAGPPVAAVHASSTPRARQTAELVAEALARTAVVETLLRVPDPGEAEGLSWAQVRAAGGRDRAAGAESWSGYLARSRRCLGELCARYPARRIVVVGHTETVAAAFAMLLGTTDLGGLRIRTGYTALTTFRALPATQRWELVGHNDAVHVVA